MKRALSVVFGVARTTLLEGLQQPAVLLLALSCMELTALQPVLQLHTFGEEGRLARDCGMAFFLVFGVLVSALVAGSGLAAEIRDGTAATALAKPAGRASFLAGKFLGALGVVAAFGWCSFWEVLLAVRTSEAVVETAKFYGAVRDSLCGLLSVGAPLAALALAAALDIRSRRRFGLWFFVFSAALLPLAAALLGFFDRTGAWTGAWSPGLDARLVPLGVLLFSLLAAFCALATALTTRLQTGSALALSFLVLFLGFLADGARGDWGAAGRLLYALVPDVQSFWLADELARGGRIAWRAVAGGCACALSWTVFALSLGYLSFRNKDL
ncbi:MAG: hypothetical protein IJV65_04245 [Kiritimatiellae bacterium]|nr:hypothetical protein [Kiritimatiellia bacterium]